MRFSKYLKEERIRKIIEAVYAGNIGAVEMMQFYQVATSKEIKEMERIAKKNDKEAFKRIIKKVLGISLK